jgi:hypothetical protein
MQQCQALECKRCSGHEGNPGLSDRLLCHEPARLILGYNLTESARPILAKLNGLDTEIKGLCITCTQQDDCKSRGTVGGVWRCPDYK